MTSLLSACNSMAKQSPQEMVRHSIKRQYTKDYTYQFNGKFYAQLSDVQTPPHANPPSHHNEKSLTPEQQAILHKYIQRLNHGFTIPYTGAVDLSRSKIEVIPEVRLQTRHSLSYMRLPIQLDGKEMKLYVDAEAITYWIDPFLEFAHISPVDDRYLLMQLPKVQQKHTPLIKNIIKTLPEAIEQSYMSLPQHAFTLLPMNDVGKHLHATYRIGIKMNGHDYLVMTQAMLNSIHHQLSKTPPPDGMTAKEYQEFLDKLAKFAQFGEEETQKDAQPLADMQMADEWFLDKKGRLLGQRNSLTLPEKVNQELAEFLGKHKIVTLHHDSNIQYTKKPLFTIQANESNVYDLTCLLEKEESHCPFLEQITKNLPKRNHDDDHDANQSSTDNHHADLSNPPPKTTKKPLKTKTKPSSSTTSKRK